MEDFYKSNRNERSKYRKYVAPNLSLQGQTCDPKWLPNGALGHQNEAQMTPKWSLGGPKNRRRKTTPPNNCQKVILAKIRGPIFEQFLVKSRCQKWSYKAMSQKSWFGRFWADFGVTFWLILATFGPSTSKKRRTGENVKISTAPKREAHFRGFIKVQSTQNTTRNRTSDTHFSRDDSGTHLGAILADFGLQKGSQNESKTTSKMRSKKRCQTKIRSARSPSEWGVRGEVGGTGGRRKEQVLDHGFGLTRRSRLAQGQGAAEWLTPLPPAPLFEELIVW